MASSKNYHHEIALARLNGGRLPKVMEDFENSETFAQLQAIFDEQQPFQEQSSTIVAMGSNGDAHIEVMKEKLKTAASIHTISYFQPTTECGEAFEVESSKSGAPTSRFKVDTESSRSDLAAQDTNQDSHSSHDGQMSTLKNGLPSTPKRRGTTTHKQDCTPTKMYVNGNDKYISRHKPTKKRRSMLPVKIVDSKKGALIPSSNIGKGESQGKAEFSAKDEFNRRQENFGAGSTLRIADDAREVLMGTKKKPLQRNKSLPLVPDETKLPIVSGVETKKTYVKKSFVPSSELNTSKSFAKGSVSTIPITTRQSTTPRGGRFSHLARPTASTTAKETASKAAIDRRRSTANNIKKPVMSLRERFSGLLAKRRRTEIPVSTITQPDDRLRPLILVNANAAHSNMIVASTELTPPPSRGSPAIGYHVPTTGFDIASQTALITESIHEGGEQLRRLMAAALRIEDKERKVEMMVLVEDCMEAINVVHEASATLVKMDMALHRFSAGIQTLGLMTASVASRAASELE